MGIITNNPHMDKTLLERQIAKLPPNWTFLTGLYFPLIIRVGGKNVVFNDYNTYHAFIKKTFMPTANYKHNPNNYGQQTKETIKKTNGSRRT